MIEDMSRTQIEYLIDEWIHNQRNRMIMKSRLLDGLTYEKLSEKYDLSVTQIKTIVRKSEVILIKYREVAYEEKR